MRHPRTDALELQIDKLLRTAAEFEPDAEAPFDMVDRAMQRATRQIAVVRVQRPIVALLWGSAAGAAAASAAAAFLMTSQPATNARPPNVREAGVTAEPPFQIVAQQSDTTPVTSAAGRRLIRVRRALPHPRHAAEEATVRQAAWRSEEVEHALEQTLQPGLRFQLDEHGRPIDVQAGVFETLTVTENPSTCVAPDTTNALAANGSAENSGESRPEEADLPSKED